MAPSRRLSALALVPLFGGCDLVFDIGTEAEPCELASFTDATAVDIVRADDFSANWAMTFAVVTSDGASYEIDLATSILTPIDLGPYQYRGLSLAPEGNSMFYTAGSEPMILKGALRGGTTQWLLDATTPRGTFAGTPSADVFGPRRVLIRERENTEAIQEYEDVAGRWMPVGEPRTVASRLAPNLTPNGLTMVFVGTDDEGMPAVQAAQRPSIAEWFGPVTTLRSAPGITSAQLLGECKRLYTVEPVEQGELGEMREISTLRLHGR